MLITIDNDPGYAPGCYLICKVTGEPGYRNWDTRDERITILVQYHDFVSLAQTFGFKEKQQWSFQKRLRYAIAFLDDLCNCADERRFIEDPGYFEEEEC
jgi:hypothetical protein